MARSCDSFVALKNATLDNSIIFAKLSDREVNEAQGLRFIPGQKHSKGSTVKCTFMEIPQVEETYSILVSCPFWMWGAEMGVNQFGVCIGNEAIFTDKISPLIKKNKDVLLGVDLLRLMLERSKTARESIQVLESLLLKYDQGGNNSHIYDTLYYHSSFLIVDPTEGWIVETSGREWVAKKIKGDVASISNLSQIGDKWDLCSEGLKKRYKYSPTEENKFDFSSESANHFFNYFAFGVSRQCRSFELLSQKKPLITVSSMIEICRDHSVYGKEKPIPSSTDTGAALCMHFGFGPMHNYQTTGGFIVALKDNDIQIWVTCTSAPCTAIWKPLWFDILDKLPLVELVGPFPSHSYQPECLWWKHEVLHRLVLMNYETRLKAYKQERDSLENSFFQRVKKSNTQNDSNERLSVEEKVSISRQCFKEAEEKEIEWINRVKVLPKGDNMSVGYSLTFNFHNFRAKMGEDLANKGSLLKDLVYVVIIVAPLIALLFFLIFF